MIIFLLTFAINVAIITYMLFLAECLVGVFPLPRLEEAFVWLNWSYTDINVALVIAAWVVAAYILLAFLPPAQWLIRYASGVRKLSDEEYRFLQQSIDMLKDDGQVDMRPFQWYIARGNRSLNAFALGSNSIVVTEGLLYSFDAQSIAGILAHEMGHITHHDTHWGLATYMSDSLGNFVLRLYIMVVNILAWGQMIPFIGLVFTLMVWLVRLQLFVLQWFVRVPVSFVSRVLNRRSEYAADRFACEIGFGAELHNSLLRITEGEEELGWWKSLQATHPETRKRLERIRAYVEAHGE